MPISGTMTIWAEPIKRGDLRLVSGDIQEARASFKDKMGQEARLVILHPRNENLASEAEGVKVRYLGGCLRGEVWLSSEDAFIELLKVPEMPLEVHEEEIHGKSITEQQKTKMLTLNKEPPTVNNFVLRSRFKGRPKTYKKWVLPEGRIKQLYEEGEGYKAIATLLKKEGFDISHMTIQRMLSGQRSKGVKNV